MITLERFRKLEVGAAVHDMHYGLPSLEIDGETLEVFGHVRWRMACGSGFIESNVGRMYTNKYAVVVERTYEDVIVVNYSYDDRYFGVFCIREKH